MNESQGGVLGFVNGLFDTVGNAVQGIGAALDKANQAGQDIRIVLTGEQNPLGSQGTGGSGAIVPQSVSVSTFSPLMLFAVIGAAVFIFAK